MAVNRLKAALWYLRRAYSVFPTCRDKKVPLVPWKPRQTALPNVDNINEWWNRWPDANISTATGEIINATIIDCDTADAIEKIESYLPDSLLCPTARTPKNGLHFYFSHTPGLKNWVGVFNGVDIRTTGGQVLLPPSTNGDRQYRWLDGLSIHQVPRPPMPPKLLQAILDATKKDEPVYRERKTEPGVYGATALAREIAALSMTVKGQRNSALNRSAHSLGQLVAGGELDAGQVEAALTSIAISIGLKASEVTATIKSGMTAGATRPRKSRTNFECRQRNPQDENRGKKYARVQLIRPARSSA